MNFFRRLDAMSRPTVAAPAADTRRDPEATTDPAAWIPVPEHPEIWAALAAVGNSNGVIDHTTAAQFLPANNPEGELQ